MGIKLMGYSEINKPSKCAYCGRKTYPLLKFYSDADKKTARICPCHWKNMAKNLRAWDEFTALTFPKWGLRCYGKEWYVERGLDKLIAFKARGKKKGKSK